MLAVQRIQILHPQTISNLQYLPIRFKVTSSMDCRSLSEVTLSKASYMVKIRIVRLWDSSNPHSSDELISVDFVMVDEMGSAMQGTIRAQDAAYFKLFLEEGKVYTVSNFIVSPNRKNFRAVPNSLLWRFTRSTSLKCQVEDVPTIPMYKFFFVDFEEVANRIYKDICLTDVVGHIVSTSHLGQTYIKDTLTRKKNLEIEDLSGRNLMVTLWGKIAESFPESIVLEKSNAVVIVLAGMTVRTFMGRTCLCSSSATKFFIDLDIPETSPYRDRLFGTPTLMTVHSSFLTSKEEASDNQKTIVELENLDPKLNQNIKFSCSATIISIDVSDGWWYRACPHCKAGLKTFEDKLWCDRCSSFENSPLSWYKLNIVVQDQSGCASFIMFGKIVSELVGIPCSTLAANPSHDRYTLPPVLENLVGQSFIFRVLLGFRDFRKKTQIKVIKIFQNNTHAGQQVSGIDCEAPSSISATAETFSSTHAFYAPSASSLIETTGDLKRKVGEDATHDSPESIQKKINLSM